MIRTFTLDAEFADSDGKARHLRLKNVDPTKTADQIKTALTKLTKLDLFEKDGVGLFKEVRHATIIEKIEETIFDKRINEQAEPSGKGMETAEAPTVEALSPVKAESAKTFEDSQIPQDVTITEERPEPGVLIQAIGLPIGCDPWSLNEEQAFSLILSCMPAGAALLNIEVDDQSVPARLIVTEAIEEKAVQTEASDIDESLPEKPKKRRKRLIDRIRKRE
ncbi:DUF2922 family protein [Enterococcus raffinosus]|uniref:DUF2922 family protein n=1 Tax=Enterococcus raffinosus TaxID=71452 RepID=UPI0007644091|nr:DUF2922 family protein [Enterococcus raffinosus]OJG84307.1 hypothetical protein RV13_GL002227 [Enterococcus raffinosus]